MKNNKWLYEQQAKVKKYPTWVNLQNQQFSKDGKNAYEHYICSNANVPEIKSILVHMNSEIGIMVYENTNVDING